MGDYAIVDSSRSPIIHVRVVGEPTDKSYSEYLDDLGAAFRELDRFAMVFNTGDLGQLPPKYRDMQARWLADTEGEFKGRWVSSAFIIKSRVIRGVLMTLFWLNKPYYAHKVAASEEEAWTWTRQQLVDAGVSQSERPAAADGS